MHEIFRQDILIGDEPDPQVYDVLKKLDLGEALGPAPKQCHVGLNAASRLIEQVLDLGGGGQASIPDLLFLETSLFPGQVKIGDQLRDFAFLQVQGGTADQQDADFKRITQTFGKLYTTLHDLQHTIYYLPSFFKPSTMGAYISRYPVNGGPAVTPRSSQYDTHLQSIRAALNAAAETEVTWYEDDDRKREQTRTWYGFRDLQPWESDVDRREYGRTDEQDQFDSVALFHELFHQMALSDYACSYLWCVPLVGGSAARKGSLYGLGAVFAVAAYRRLLDPPLQLPLKRKIAQSLSYLMKDALAPYVYHSAVETLVTAREHAIRAAIGAIMGRNMSHNIGSHAIARLDDETIRRAPQGIERMLQYLQERMDFVARVSHEWPRWREPALFFADLLKGYLRQGVLLDNLIADDGYGAARLEFLVRAPGCSEFVRYVYDGGSRTQAGGAGVEEESPAEFRRASSDGDASPPDFLVAIPGGPVGRQAFYGFLENALRNAAKHNPNRGTLQVVLDFVAGGDDVPRMTGAPLYRVRYQDSVSELAGRNGVLGSVQTHLTNEIVDRKTGLLVSEGWGIQEMKVYAGYLTQTPGVALNRERVLEARREPFVIVDDAGREVLTYEFALQRPCLAYIVAPDLAPQDESMALRHGLKVAAATHWRPLADAPSELQKVAPGLLYLVVDDDDDELVEWLEHSRLWLPARILLSPRKRERIEHLRGLLDGTGLSHRVRIDPEARTIDETLAGSATEEAVKACIIELFRRWILATLTERGLPAPLNVVVYFDRAGSSHAGRWAALGETVSKYGLGDLIRVFPVQKEIVEPSERNEWDVALREPWAVASRALRADQGDFPGVLTVDPAAREGTWIVFDNHGNGNPRDLTPEFYQYVGSSPGGVLPNNRDMFDRLANVPTDYSGVYFLLQLVESALLKVLVMDERVTGSVLALKTKDDGEPVLTWAESGGTSYGQLLTLYLGRAGFSLVPFYNFEAGGRLHRCCLLRSEGTPAWSVEGNRPSGLTLREGAVQGGRVLTAVGRRAGLYDLDLADGPRAFRYDAVIIHRGLLERIEESAREHGVPYEESEFLRSLYRLAARVVITSGRGPQRQGPLTAYPFIEFAAVQAFMVRELSKLSLASVLMSVTGEGIPDAW